MAIVVRAAMAAAVMWVGVGRTAAAQPAAISAAAVRAIAEADRPENEKLAEYHLLASQYPNDFSWALHNEIRHLYAGRNERASMGQCEIILSHVPDDEYILNILSNWTLGKDTAAAISELEEKARRYRDLRHVSAACRLAVRSLREGQKTEAP